MILAYEELTQLPLGTEVFINGKDKYVYHHNIDSIAFYFHKLVLTERGVKTLSKTISRGMINDGRAIIYLEYPNSLDFILGEDS